MAAKHKPANGVTSANEVMVVYLGLKGIGRQIASRLHEAASLQPDRYRPKLFVLADMLGPGATRADQIRRLPVALWTFIGFGVRALIA